MLTPEEKAKIDAMVEADRPMIERLAHECRDGVRERLACLEAECGKTTRERVLEELLDSLLLCCQRAMEERCSCEGFGNVMAKTCAYHTIKAKASAILNT
jgi:hypothetical protein